MNYLTLETPRTKSNSLDSDFKNLKNLIKLSGHNKIFNKQHVTLHFGNGRL